jgi:peptidoglycan/LPS O-acetylase OafA/YrhL
MCRTRHRPGRAGRGVPDRELAALGGADLHPADDVGDGLFIGCAVALGWKAGLFPTRIPSALVWFGWLTLFFLGLWQSMRVSGPTYGPVLTSIAVVSAVLVLAAARGEGGLPTGLLASRPARWVGRRSYGIYLWNASLIAAVPRRGNPTSC